MLEGNGLGASIRGDFSAVPRVFPSLPPLDSLVCVGELGEEPGQHMTLRFRVKPTHCDTETRTHMHTHTETPSNVTTQSNLVAKRGLFKNTTNKQQKAQTRLKMEEQLFFPGVLRHPPLCSSPLVSFRQVFWQRPTPFWQLKALHICRLVW